MFPGTTAPAAEKDDGASARDPCPKPKDGSPRPGTEAGVAGRAAAGAFDFEDGVEQRKDVAGRIVGPDDARVIRVRDLDGCDSRALREVSVAARQLHLPNACQACRQLSCARADPFGV